MMLVLWNASAWQLAGMALGKYRFDATKLCTLRHTEAAALVYRPQWIACSMSVLGNESRWLESFSSRLG